MKNMWVKVSGMVFIALLVLDACTESQTKKATPTIGPAPIPVLLGSYATLSPEDMRLDLDELFNKIETNHPNPYTRRPKSEVDLERQRIYQELSQPLTVIDFYKKTAPLVASLGDHHTQILLSNEIWEEIDTKERFFPLEVAFQGHQAFVIADHTANPDIPLGAELLAINGIPLTDVQSRFLHVRDMPFSMQLWFLIGSIPEYQVDMLPSGKTTPLQFMVPGLTLAEITEQGPAAPPWEALTYRTLPGEKIGVLTINSFFEMTDLLQPAFAQIQKDQVQHLILDIRANRGGYYEAVARLMDYLTDQPYQTCSRKYKAPPGGYGSGDPRETKCALTRPVDVPERFHGKLYLLLGRETISAGITLATILQDFDLATLIGEETTDPASHCADIAAGGILLPRTKLRYISSRTCYVRPSGVRDDRGVVPDVIVEPTIADLVAGNDPVLDRTLEIIRNSDPIP